MRLNYRARGNAYTSLGKRCGLPTVVHKTVGYMTNGAIRAIDESTRLNYADYARKTSGKGGMT